ncbi:non-ribosomal peptide synthetase [Tengunoibacter tsumagoiensis]|uniref:Carrier domain-containing protein n=1 Tax=Tengunoibacter tsumagoiensis TaxID=2014871 RepID=A0A402A9U8_9CHLR|nr:non-ribosomal peptide synthetase [Tengunoibacter tsumagoiensis]GCE15725.1 hypothetical protein KTT_55840 [Tengunoibacter tsumagoiensis]
MDRPLSEDLLIAGNQRVVEREYWLKKLSDDVQRGYIPYDFPVDVRKDQMIVCDLFTLPQPLAHSCHRLANGSKNNLYILLCGCLAVLVSKYTSHLDLVLGAPVLNEAPVADLLNLVIPLRLQLQESMTFKQLLMYVKAQHLEGVAHQNYPVEMLAAQLGSKAAISTFPLFDIVVLLEDIHIQQFFYKTAPALTFSFRAVDENLSIAVSYDSALYEKQTITRLAQRFIYLLGEMIAHKDDGSVMDLAIAKPDECHSWLAPLDRTAVAFPAQATVTQLFEEAVALFPTNIALQFGHERVTYAELNSQANRLARVLRARGIQPDAIIGIYAERSLEMVIGMLAVLKAGAAYLPLDPIYPPDRVAYMVEDSQVQSVLTQASLIDQLPASLDRLLLDDRHLYQGVDDTNLEPIHNERSLAYIIYTSGTTGQPKGVMIEHQQVARLFRNEQFPFAFNEHDTWTMFHSFCFDFSVWEMYGALFNGGRLIVIPRTMTVDMSSYLALLKQERVTILNQTPGAFFRLAEEESKDDQPTLALRYVIFGGEALKPGRLASWSQRYPQIQLINMYGITETTVHVTYKEITREDIQLDVSTIGRPIPTTSVSILDARLNPVPNGVPGELFVGGEGVARGYLHKPELTQQRFIPDPFHPGKSMYRTGDLGRLRNNGEIEFIGRADQQVKIRGFRIEIGEIEAQIMKFAGIANTIVLPVEDTDGEHALCAYIVVGGTPGDQSELALKLKEYVRQYLPAYMVPAFIVPISELPLTEHGKIHKALLPDPRDVIPVSIGYLAPRNQLERQLVEIWAHILKLPEDKIGIHDRFFDLGGNSFSVIALHTKVQETFKKQIPIMSYFQYPTIVSFVEHMQQMHDDHQETDLSEEEAEPEEMYSMMDALTQLAEAE